MDQQGRLVGRLTKSFMPPKAMMLESVRVIAVIQRYRDDSAVEYQSSIKCDQWEIIIRELIYGAQTETLKENKLGR